MESKIIVIAAVLLTIGIFVGGASAVFDNIVVDENGVLDDYSDLPYTVQLRITERVNLVENSLETMPGTIDGDYVACGSTAEYIGGKLETETGADVVYNLYRKTGTNMMHVTVLDTGLGLEFETVSPAFTDAYNENTNSNYDYRGVYFDRQDEFTLVRTYDTYQPIGDTFSSGAGGVYTDTITDETLLGENDSWLDEARERMEGTSIFAGYYAQDSLLIPQIETGSTSIWWGY